MLKIYLARHGQDEDNSNGILNGQRDTPLTEIGVKQTQALAEKIKNTGLKFEKIYSSPLKRAHKTAKIIAEKLAATPPTKLDLLIERNFGILTGLNKDKIIEICKDRVIKTETINYFLDPEGAETFPDLINRSKKVLEYIQQKHKDGNILLVAHGDIGKMIYAAYYNLDWKDVLKLFHFGNSNLIILSPDSKLEEVHKFKIKQYNT